MTTAKSWYCKVHLVCLSYLASELQSRPTIPKMLTQMDRIWSRAKWLTFPKSTENSARDPLMSSTISNKHWREPEKRVPIAETQRWEADSTGRATRPCKVLEDLSHYFKAEKLYFDYLFFQIPKHQDSSSKQNSKFSGIPDVKFAFILAKEKKISAYIGK